MNKAYEVLVARPVIEDLTATTGRVRSRFFKATDLLQSFPELGHEYVAEPYEDTLPFSCREHHLPDTSKTMYYTIDSSLGIVKVFALLDQRQNPSSRFCGIDESRLDI